jgi:hypothetical protein
MVDVGMNLVSRGRNSMGRFSQWLSGGAAVMLAVYALGSDALASVPQAPEISPGSISAGVALLAGGVLMLRARRGSK